MRKFVFFSFFTAPLVEPQGLFRGLLVHVHFWASWVGGCREEGGGGYGFGGVGVWGGPTMKSPMTLPLFWFHVHSSLSRSLLEVLLLFSWTSFGGVGSGGAGGSWPSSCSLQSLDLLISSTLPPAEPLNCCHFLPPSIFKRLEFSGSRGSAATHSVRISLEILKHILNFFFSFVHAAAPNIKTKSDHMAPTRAAIRAASQGR